MLRDFANRARHVALTVDIDDDPNTNTLQVGSTANFLDLTAPFILAIDRGQPNEEVCLCTARDAGTFTVIRGYDETLPQEHDVGATVEHTTAAIDFREANQHVNAAAPHSGHATPADLAPLLAHLLATTSVHGIADTSQIAYKNVVNTFVSEQIVQRALATDPALSVRVGAEANPRWQWRPGALLAGPGGAVPLDLLFKRGSSTEWQIRDAADSAFRDLAARGLYGEVFYHRADPTRHHRWGSGNPEGVVSGGVGAKFTRIDGSPGNIEYVKESGSGTTGWKVAGGMRIKSVQRGVFNGAQYLVSPQDVTISAVDTTKADISLLGYQVVMQGTNIAGARLSLINSTTLRIFYEPSGQLISEQVRVNWQVIEWE